MSKLQWGYGSKAIEPLVMINFQVTHFIVSNNIWFENISTCQEFMRFKLLRHSYTHARKNLFVGFLKLI